MATSTGITIRTAQAIERLRTTAGTLAERFPNVEAPEIPTKIRYPDMLGLLQLEALATFLDAVAADTKPKAEAKTQPKDESKAAPKSEPAKKATTDK